MMMRFLWWSGKKGWIRLLRNPDVFMAIHAADFLGEILKAN
jgi:hypothetical protein